MKEKKKENGRNCGGKDFFLQRSCNSSKVWHNDGKTVDFGWEWLGFGWK